MHESGLLIFLFYAYSGQQDNAENNEELQRRDVKTTLTGVIQQIRCVLDTGRAACQHIELIAPD